jgi:CMP-N-acetylneuraminic acid synthetase
MSRFLVKGVNDEKDSCECCGRQGLKRVVWIEDTETNEIKHFGTTCALKPAKGFASDAEIKRAIRDFEHSEKSFWMAVYRMYRNAGGQYEMHPTEAYSVPSDRRLYDECAKQLRERQKRYDAMRNTTATVVAA